MLKRKPLQKMPTKYEVEFFCRDTHDLETTIEPESGGIVREPAQNEPDVHLEKGNLEKSASHAPGCSTDAGSRWEWDGIGSQRFWMKIHMNYKLQMLRNL